MTDPTEPGPLEFDPHAELIAMGARLTPTTAQCVVHGVHRPTSHVQENHHIWPQGLGGPNVAENLVYVCATGHNNIHRLMALMAKARSGDLPYEVTRSYAREELRLAQLGYRRSIEQRL